MVPDATNVTLFIINIMRGIFLFSKNNLFISSNDLENRKTEPKRQEDKIIELHIFIILLL